MFLHFLSFAGGGSIVDLDGTFFIQLGFFFVMFIFLYAVLFRPAVRMIDARREATVGAIENAREQMSEAAVLMSKIDSQISDVRVAATAEKDKIIEQARHQERDLLAKARQDSQKIVKTSRSKIEKDGETTRQKLESEIQVMADAVTNSILK